MRDTNRREFLKDMAAAFSLLAADPMRALAVVSSGEPTASLKALSEPLTNLFGTMAILPAGANEPAKLMQLVAEAVAERRRLHDLLPDRKMSPQEIERAAAYIADSYSRRFPEQRIHDDAFRASQIGSYAQMLKVGVEYAAMDEQKLLDLAMEWAVEGNKIWLSQQQYRGGSEATHARSKAADTPRVLRGGDGAAQDLESLLAREDVKIFKSGNGLRIVSLDPQALDAITPLLDGCAHRRHNACDLIVEPASRSLISLARPYIADYPECHIRGQQSLSR